MSIADEILNIGLNDEVKVIRYFGFGFGEHRIWKKVSQKTFEEKNFIGKILGRYSEHKMEFIIRR